MTDEQLNLYRLREALILSGQVPDARVQELLREDRQFAQWVRERAGERRAA